MTSTKDLRHAAHEILAESGQALSNNMLKHTVRRFRFGGEPGDLGQYLANAVTYQDQRRAIAYADPTGETAVRNVLRGAS